MNTPYALTIYAAIGGLLAQGLHYYWCRRRNLKFDFFTTLLVIAFSATITTFYFKFVDPNSNPFSYAQLGMFVGLLADEVINYINNATQRSNPAETEEPQPTPGGYAISPIAFSGALILNGWLPVWGVGCLGAIATEAYRVRSSKKNNQRFDTIYWITSLIIIALSGMIVVFQGTLHVNALTAFQLGATPPLALKKLMPK